MDLKNSAVTVLYPVCRDSYVGSIAPYQNYGKMLVLNKIKILLNSNCWRTNYLRLIKQPTKTSTSNYSTTKSLWKKKDEPYKFSGSKAEKLSMDESFFRLENKLPHRKIEVACIWLSTAAFMIYFGILREENQYDEILKGNYESDPLHPSNEFQLTMQYDHCKKHNLHNSQCDDVLKQLNQIRKAKGRFLLDY